MHIGRSARSNDADRLLGRKGQDPHSQQGTDHCTLLSCNKTRDSAPNTGSAVVSASAQLLQVLCSFAGAHWLFLTLLVCFSTAYLIGCARCSPHSRHMSVFKVWATASVWLQPTHAGKHLKLGPNEESVDGNGRCNKDLCLTCCKPRETASPSAGALPGLPGLSGVDPTLLVRMS